MNEKAARTARFLALMAIPALTTFWSLFSAIRTFAAFLSNLLHLLIDTPLVLAANICMYVVEVVSHYASFVPFILSHVGLLLSVLLIICPNFISKRHSRIIAPSSERNRQLSTETLVDNDERNPGGKLIENSESCEYINIKDLIDADKESALLNDSTENLEENDISSYTTLSNPEGILVTEDRKANGLKLFVHQGESQEKTTVKEVKDHDETDHLSEFQETTSCDMKTLSETCVESPNVIPIIEISRNAEYRDILTPYDGESCKRLIKENVVIEGVVEIMPNDSSMLSRSLRAQLMAEFGQPAENQKKVYEVENAIVEDEKLDTFAANKKEIIIVGNDNATERLMEDKSGNSGLFVSEPSLSSVLNEANGNVSRYTQETRKLFKEGELLLGRQL